MTICLRTRCFPVFLFIMCISLPSLAQELPIDDGPPDIIPPEEIIPPPELPPLVCAFDFSVHAQTSQGVLQNDPKDTNFLKEVQGSADLSDIFFGVAPYFGAPTFEGEIDMVVGRNSYLLGAKPYPANGPPALLNTNPNISKLRFSGSSYFSDPVMVDCRVSVYQNQVRIAQFIASSQPRPIFFAGTCSDENKGLDYELDVFENKANTDISFKFTGPGEYMVRAELVFHDDQIEAISELRSTGIAVNVIGNIVKTKAPKVLLFPVIKAGYSAAAQNDYLTQVQGYASTLAGDMQNYMAIPNGQADVLTQANMISGSNLNSFKDVAALFGKGIRSSNPLTVADRAVVVIEEILFNQLMTNTYGNQPNFANIRYSVGFPLNKKVIVIRGPTRTANTSAPYFFYNFVLAQNPHKAIMQSLLQTFNDPLWQPAPNRMGDCKVTPYFQKELKIAYGVNVSAPGQPSIYTASQEVMGNARSNAPSKVCQCTYRHSLAALSKTLIDPPMVVVSGKASMPGLLSPEAELGHLYQVDGFPELSPNGVGRWKMVLKDRFDTTLASYPFEPNFHVNGFYVNQAFFNYTLDAPPSLDRVEIYGPVLFITGYGHKLLDTIDYSANPPGILDVWVNAVGNRYEVVWFDFDFNGDPLYASVLLSEDGQFFYPTDVFETQASRAILDIPAHIQFVKVVVTDGSESTEHIVTL